LTSGKRKQRVRDLFGSMDVAPPSAKSRSTIWQLANQERRVAMVLLQKKQRHAVERW